MKVGLVEINDELVVGTKGKTQMRPWFISISAVLESARNFPEFQEEARKQLAFKPAHQIEVPEHIWHFTVLPLVKVRGLGGGPSSAEAEMTRLWHNHADLLPTVKEITSQWSLSVELDSFRCYNDGLCPNLKSSDLADLREELKKVYTPFHDALRQEHGVTSEWKDGTKTKGDRCYGSIARAPAPEDDILRWERKPDEPITLTFDEIKLVISDEFLSNPAAHAKQPMQRIKLKP